MTHIQLAAVIVAVLSAGGAGQSQERSSRPERPGICEREGAKIAGRKPMRAGRGIGAPKKLRHVAPAFPELPLETRGRGIWIGEVLLDQMGKVAHIWPIREVEFTLSFPAFNQSIIDAIDRWEFEPVFVGTEATPLSLTVTVNVNWS